nr:uncharacterized protein LOC128690670 [Cherax quadricarinatus]
MLRETCTSSSNLSSLKLTFCSKMVLNTWCIINLKLKYFCNYDHQERITLSTQPYKHSGRFSEDLMKLKNDNFSNLLPVVLILLFWGLRSYNQPFVSSLLDLRIAFLLPPHV